MLEENLKKSETYFITPFYKEMLKQKSNKKFLQDENKCAMFFEHMRGKSVSICDLRKIKLNNFFIKYHDTNSYIPCALIKGNIAWISQKNGEYRYFSRMQNKEILTLDIFDLLQIQLNKNYKELCNWFKLKLDINLCDNFFKEQTEKYLNNIDFTSSETFENCDMRKVIKQKEEIYNELNKIGLENLFSKTLVQMDNAVFFASNSYLRERLDGKYSTSTICKVINTFAALGMINKVKENDIPIEFKDLSVVKFKNFTSFYSIPSLQDNFKEIEAKSSVFLEHNLCYYNVNKKKVEEIFGKKTCKNIYVQDTYKGKLDIKNNKGDLSKLFKSIFNELGYISKQIFLDSVLLKMPNLYSKADINKEYTKLVEENGLRIVKPNKRLKTKLGLVDSTSVAIKL